MTHSLKNNKRAIILVMIAFSFIVITFSYFYYKNVNASKDPRVKPARELYEKYNDYAIKNDFYNLFALLDSVEFIYKKYRHFSESFEVGVLYNNRAAAFLTMAIHKNVPESFSNCTNDSLFKLSKLHVEKSIVIYEKWLSVYDSLSTDQIKELLQKDYLSGLETFSSKEIKHFISNRVQEIETAQYETKRRLSVSYTNLGIIYRHADDYKHAIEYYQKAMELWDKNLTAENNLNILLGKPLKKRNLIQKLFPAERKK